MKKHSFSLQVLALVLCTVLTIGVFSIPRDISAKESKELRGVWVSTVSNIDYPKTQTTDAGQLKSEMLTILDNCKAMGFNAVFFQVRPCGDAFYKSDIFPWSRYLTGTQGQAPNDGFDPLEFAVSEAHKRGLELHAWINPYRLTTSSEDTELLSSDSIPKRYPNLLLTTDNDTIYLNPGDSASIDLIVSGAVEIASNYQVDGIHMDDYFYPSGTFNDDGTYSYYKREYPSKGDWRREMVNRLIQKMDKALHRANPEIQFGVSPKGIWANNTEHPDGSATAGNSSYSSVYADSRAWVQNGWVDYIMPQIYWHIGYEIADYSVLTDWWAKTVAGTDVKLYIGEAAYKTAAADQPAWADSSGISELKRHIELGRYTDTVDGYCMFTYHNFADDTALFDLMTKMNVDQPAPIAPGTPTDAGKFTDLGSYSWALDAVYDLAEKGIIRGQSETQFAPNAYITRADNLILLLRVLGKNAAFPENFYDVYPSDYYYTAVGTAKVLDITTGMGDNLFCPTTLIRRQDMATLAYRVLNRESILTSIPNTGVLNHFSDNGQIDFYARDAMAACVSAGLMGGYGDGTLNPQGNATRIEVAIFIHRVQKLLENADIPDLEA